MQQNIDSLKNNRQLGDDLYQIKKRAQGGELNVLLKGRYVSRAQAVKAVSGLPGQWQGKTWIRPVNDLRLEQMN